MPGKTKVNGKLNVKNRKEKKQSFNEIEVYYASSKNFMNKKSML